MAREQHRPYRAKGDDVEVLPRRGLAQVATGAAADRGSTTPVEDSARYGSALTIGNGRAVLEVATARQAP